MKKEDELTRNKREELIVVACVGLIFMLTASVYVLHFHTYDWSENPSDWGTVGDYMGGILNPIISFLALIYLVKAYRSQKQELKETKGVLEQTEKHNLKLAQAQVSLANTIESQLTISKDSHKAKLISFKIDSRAKYLTFLQNELNRVSVSIANKHTFYDLDSKKLFSHDEAHKYRLKMIREVKSASSDLAKLEEKLDTLLESNT